jgi:hypothetical protein
MQVCNRVIRLWRGEACVGLFRGVWVGE